MRDDFDSLIAGSSLSCDETRHPEVESPGLSSHGAMRAAACVERRVSCLTTARQRDETHRVECVLAVARAPMQMRAGHPARRADEPDLLSPLDRIADRDVRLREVEIPGHDAAAVIHIHHVPREKEVLDESNDAAIRGAHRITRLPREIHPPVTARQTSVEDASRPKAAGDARASWSYEWLRPEFRRRMGATADGARFLVLSLDARCRE